MKNILATVSILIAHSLLASDLAETAREVLSVRTHTAGTVSIRCDEPGSWKFSATATQSDGRDVISVTITSETDSTPPKFGVLCRVSGAGVQNVWTADSSASEDGRHLWPQLWWKWSAKHISQLACDSPIAVGFNSRETAPIAIACSDAFNYLEYALYVDDHTCDIIGRFEFFRQPVAKTKSYTAKILIDRRNGGFAQTVRDCTEWILSENNFTPAPVPESAYDPLYSTWYAYLQDVNAKPLENEARLAAELGMKTMILDDGWQKVESRTFYSATGDWMPVPSRFPDMKAHVDAVHATGLKYMLWLGVPLVGDEAKCFPRFKDKLIRCQDGTGTFDPRFPEVREYLISTYERVIRDWGFDGVKLDFIDQFVFKDEKDPALADNYAGRDYRSLPAAVNRLMMDVRKRLTAIKPDVLIEFRQRYMGPAILQYGNMIRVSDCPADPCANRRRLCDLRLTSGKTAVHSDMLVWSKNETPEGAALPILNVIFGTIQYSMVLADISLEHKAVVRHWITFSTIHRDALLKGSFTPHHAENGYPWVESESASERIIASYSNANFLPTGRADKPVYVINATGSHGLTLDAPANGTIELFDVFGKQTHKTALVKGLSRIDVPPSGYAKISW